MREKKKKESHNPSTSSYLPNTNVCAYECGLMHIINSLNTKKKTTTTKKLSMLRFFMMNAAAAMLF